MKILLTSLCLFLLLHFVTASSVSSSEEDVRSEESFFLYKVKPRRSEELDVLKRLHSKEEGIQSVVFLNSLTIGKTCYFVVIDSERSNLESSLKEKRINFHAKGITLIEKVSAQIPNFTSAIVGLPLTDGFPQLPTGRFQLRNPKTGMCAVILKNSDAAWAKVVAHSCSCQNVYHYWKLNKKVQTQTLVSEGRSRQCLANWEALGHPGVTQCGCAEDEIHWWSFSPFEDGSFNLVTAVDRRCVYVNGTVEDNQLRFKRCDRDDAEQRWIFYDACPPGIIWSKNCYGASYGGNFVCRREYGQEFYTTGNKVACTPTTFAWECTNN